MYLTADRVNVDTDEGEITLEIYTVDGDRLTLNIHGIDLDAFYESVRSGVGGYLRERDEALRSRPEGVVVAVREDGSFRCDPDESGGLRDGEAENLADLERIGAEIEESGYMLDDPKHPRYHSTHVDIWDTRAGK